MSNQTQAEKPAAPVIYTYDKQTGEYKPDAKATCQWSPREAKWLIPAAATTTEPPTAGEKQAACFDAASKAWVLKADHRGEKWYDKSTRELHEIKDIGVEPDTENWTQTEPKDLEAVWGEETSSWVIPTEVQEQRDVATAQNDANAILRARAFKTVAETEMFSITEFATLGKAKMYDEWQPNTEYAKGKRLTYNGRVYEVQQQTVSSEVYPPDAEGVLALYVPLSTDGSGTLEDPYVWIYGMHVEAGVYVTYNGQTYKAISPMRPCTWVPGSDTNVWEVINNADN